MVQFNTALLKTMFGNNTSSKVTSSGSSGSYTIITGIALSDSEDGYVEVQIGDPVETLIDEDNDIFAVVDDEDTVNNVDDDILAEEPGEDDGEYDEEDFEETPIVYIGEDEESDEGDEIPVEEELEVVE